MISSSSFLTFLKQQVVDVQFIHGETSAEPKLQSTSLKWWDILLIALGCLAVVVAPALLILAVSFCLLINCVASACS